MDISLQYADEQSLWHAEFKYSARDGTFEIPDLVPGDYVIRVTEMDPEPGVSGGRFPSGGGETRFRVDRSDVNDVVIHIEPLATVWGVVHMKNLDDPVLRAMDIEFGVDGASAAYWPSASRQKISPHGVFSFDVDPGEYVLSLKGLADGIYVKQARVLGVPKNQDLLGKIFRLPDSAWGPFEITLGTETGIVAGTVGDRGEAIEGAQVVLVPDEPLLRDRFQLADTDKAGAFLFDRVPPGAYHLFAFEDLASFEYFDLAMLKRHESESVPVVVPEHSKANLKLTLIHRY